MQSKVLIIFINLLYLSGIIKKLNAGKMIRLRCCLSVNKTVLRAKQLIYWPGFDNEIKQYVLSCKVCDRFKNCNTKEPLEHHKMAKLPFEIISSDILTYGGKIMLLYLIIIQSS